MKKLILITIVTFVLVHPINLCSQDFTQNIYKNELRFGGFQVLNNKAHFNFEHYFKNNKTSLTGIFELTYSKTISNTEKGYLGGIQYRYYYFTYREGEFNQDIIKGYVSIGSEFEKITYILTPYQYKDEINRKGVEFLLGFKIVMYNRITADINIGTLYNHASIIAESQTIYDLGMSNIGHKGFKPSGNLTFGFRF
ncbi:MAG: hypothetical protein K9J13_08040 [Saprospiraceae bacterium]|nr:hypothetical protein [Saprospiraceae bacterium]